VGAVVLLGLVMLTVVALLPPVPQDPAYHAFADTRPVLGVPNFLNVVSNAAFLGVGALGLLFLARVEGPTGPAASITPGERRPYRLFFAGVALTGVGSAYYHWNPSNTTLFWDRLPMTIAFMALLAAVVGEQIGARAGARGLWPLVIAGVLSVLYWRLGEQRGAGDLRPYALVQFGSMVMVPLLLLLFPARRPGTRYLWLSIGSYALGKVVESLDHALLAGVGVSGHTWKHLASAGGAYWILRMLERRRQGLPRPSDEGRGPAPAQPRPTLSGAPPSG
jgi:hypothetical protein